MEDKVDKRSRRLSELQHARPVGAKADIISPVSLGRLDLRELRDGNRPAWE
jgi:hypothetical protein